MTANSDTELEAIQKLLSALEPLDQDARTRVIDYVFRRLHMGLRQPGHDLDFLTRTPVAATSSVAPVESTSLAVSDIRSLKETKAPQTANEMAAVAAYYLSEVAPSTDRKPEIDASNIEKLFKQADFRVPGSATMTLVNAKNAGYLDAGSARGTYRLNPVGYNLVVHKLPSTDTRSSNGNSGRSRKKKRGRKKTSSSK